MHGRGGGIGDTVENGTDLLLVDVGGVLGATVPGKYLLLAAATLPLVGAGDVGEEVVVAGEAAAIHRWAVRLAAQSPDSACLDLLRKVESSL